MTRSNTKRRDHLTEFEMHRILDMQIYMARSNRRSLEQNAGSATSRGVQCRSRADCPQAACLDFPTAEQKPGSAARPEPEVAQTKDLFVLRQQDLWVFALFAVFQTYGRPQNLETAPEALDSNCKSPTPNLINKFAAGFRGLDALTHPPPRLHILKPST